MATEDLIRQLEQETIEVGGRCIVGKRELCAIVDKLKRLSAPESQQD